MPFKRHWDNSCPHIWDQWESDGTKFTIQDLPPEDDEVALKLLLEQMVVDEELCKITNMKDDEVSMRSVAVFWRSCLAQRVSLACYAEKDGKRTLAALNCCIVPNEDDKFPEFEGETWRDVFGALVYADKKEDACKRLGVDQVLAGMGLIVHRDYRGAKLGSKILAAREPMCRELGIKGTKTVFTGVAAQKSALRVGFETIAEISWKELKASGLKYPEEDKYIKSMIKKYNH